MSREKRRINRIVAVLLIALGLVLGVTWNSTKFCIGDNIFIALGLPTWSNGTSGTHYPAIIGSVFILIGIGVLNTTLQKKNRFWTVVVLLLVMLNFILGYI